MVITLPAHRAPDEFFVTCFGDVVLPVTGVFSDSQFCGTFQCAAAPQPGLNWTNSCSAYTIHAGDGLRDVVNDKCLEASCGNGWDKVVFEDASRSVPHISFTISAGEVIYHECSKRGS